MSHIAALYTVQRARLKDNTLYGPTHASNDTLFTVCDLDIDNRWWVVNNTHDGHVTCRKCLRILGELYDASSDY